MVALADISAMRPMMAMGRMQAAPVAPAVAAATAEGMAAAVAAAAATTATVTAVAPTMVTAGGAAERL